MFTKTSITMDITDSDIRVVSFEGEKVTKWASRSLGEGLVKGGTILEPKATALLIDELFTSLQLNKSRVICTLTGLPFIYRTITMPDVKGGIKVDAIEREGRRELSITEEEMFLFWQGTETNPKENEKEYFVLAVPKLQLNSLFETLSQAKLISPVIDIKALAISRAVAMKDAIIISLEKRYFEIVMVANGMVRVIHSLSSEAASDNNLAIVSDIVDGLSRAVKYFNRDYSKSALPLNTPIILGGALSSNQEILRLVRNVSGHPTEIFKPQLDLPTEMPIGIYTSNIGLMLKNKPVVTGSQYQDISVSLVPQLKKAKAFQISWSYTFLIVISVLMAFLAYKSYDLKTTTSANVVTLEQSSTRVADQLKNSQDINKTAIGIKLEKTAQFTSVSTQLTQIKDSVQLIEQQKKDYVAVIGTLKESLPVGVKYSAIEINQPEITFSGIANNPDQVLTLVGVLEKNTMFSDVRIASINPNKGEVETVYQFQIVLVMNSGL
jgi:Tfp pilus assembly protein PilN